ncbi:MAG: TrkH family potassium uptake protein [Alphaproteobacteria bacterium]|nr:MAG: TrkH family potassium uptake protein [Alphaproteobacteria bacterium]
MLDFRPVLHVIGLLLATLGLAMLVPAAVDVFAGSQDWQVFASASLTTFFIGIGMFLSTRGAPQDLDLRQAFLLTALSWVMIALFGSLPFIYAEMDLSVTDALFESMSGITTTGSTIITGLDTAPPGILMWRSLLQWMGGIGIIVMAVAVMPMLQVGGMQLFRMESSDNSEKILPRAAQIAGALALLYLCITIVCAISLWAAGMSIFESVAHAMTSVATGGYSTSDQSIGHFDSASIDVIVTVFMVLGSLPFVLYLQALRGRPLMLWRDTQVQWFFALATLAVFVMTLYRYVGGDVPILEALRFTSFNIVSIMTGTGYASTDYGSWGGFAIGLFFLVMFVGGCAGSTSCGVKIFRIQVLFETARRQIQHLLQPHGIFTPKFNDKPIPPAVRDAVMNFFFLFFGCFVVLALCLSAFGLDFITAASGAGAALANVGPGLGEIIGPTGNYASLPDGAKWFLMIGMLLGRLELIGILVLLSPTFWRG